MSSIFVQSSDSFCVDDQDINWLSIWGSALDRGAPAPETFGARIDRGSNSEAIAPV